MGASILMQSEPVEHGKKVDFCGPRPLGITRLYGDNHFLVTTGMPCPNCGRSVPTDNGRCSACGVAPRRASVAVGVAQFDTTGLPAGASFGGIGVTGAVTAGSAASEWATGLATGAGTIDFSASSAAAGPLAVGQSFS